MKRLTGTVLILSMLLAGCSMQAKFTYPLGGDIQTINPSPPNAKIAVLPTVDKRDVKNNVGGWFLYMIPLVPWGHVTYNRPEAARLFFSIGEFQADIHEDVAKAITHQWQRA